MFLYGDYSIKEWPIPWWLNIEYNGRGTSIHEVPSGNDWQKDIIPTMELSTSLIEADGSGAAEYIIVQSGRYWSAQVEEECPWIEVSNQWQGKKTIVRISVHENDGDARHGVIRFTAGPTVRTLHIHQKGAGAQESVVPEEAP